MSEKGLKVTDKRMFTPEGELREEYSFLEQRVASTPAEDDGAVTPVNGHGGDTSPGQTETGGERGSDPEGVLASDYGRASDYPQASDFGTQAAGPHESPGAVLPGAPDAESHDGEPLEIPMGSPRRAGFGDLLSMLAEPVAIYLGEAPMPDGTVQEDLEMAALHIDLLDVLRRKTAGNLTAREASYLDNVLYQLQMLYVRKRG